MKEVMKTIGLSNVDDLGGVNESGKTYLVFNENELMSKEYEIFETLKVKYLSAENGDGKVVEKKAYNKFKGWLKETSTVKSVNNINTKNGDSPLVLVSTENSSSSSTELTELCGVNIG